MISLHCWTIVPEMKPGEGLATRLRATVYQLNVVDCVFNEKLWNDAEMLGSSIFSFIVNGPRERGTLCNSLFVTSPHPRRAPFLLCAVHAKHSLWLTVNQTCSIFPR